jgi:hypothetical protein
MALVRWRPCGFKDQAFLAGAAGTVALVNMKRPARSPFTQYTSGCLSGAQRISAAGSLILRRCSPVTTGPVAAGLLGPSTISGLIQMCAGGLDEYGLADEAGRLMPVIYR